MGIEQARAHLRTFGADERIIELDESSATVENAAHALGVEPERIAKTLAFSTKNGPVLVVAAGDARMQNRAFKDTFGEKMRFLPGPETEAQIGHPPGGICPFGVRPGVRVYLDSSLRRFETVFPACGSTNSAIELSLDELEQYASPVSWVTLAASPPAD